VELQYPTLHKSHESQLPEHILTLVGK